MNKNDKFFGVGLCSLLLILLVFSANVWASEVLTTGPQDAYYENVSSSEYAESGYMTEEEDEGQPQDEYRDEGDKGYQTDEESETAPFDQEKEPATEEPSEGSDLPEASQGESE
jgi:hypothetical protein